MINATIAVIINIILNIVLSRYLGIGGLALATSISAIVGTVLLFMALRRKIGSFGLREISKSFIKISLASMVMGLIALASFNYLKHYFRDNVSLIIAIGVGVLVYGILVYFMRIPEADRTVELIKSKIKGKIGKKGE